MPNFIAVGQTVNTRKALLFGQPFVKRFALCYRTVVCPVCLFVCLSCLSHLYRWYVLGPNSSMDQDET